MAWSLRTVGYAWCMNHSLERSTRQRSALLEVLQQAARPLLAQELLLLSQELVPGLGQATVYRNLKALVEDGVLAQVTLPGENPRYELAGLTHHHHFKCQTCDRVFDILGCPGASVSLVPPGFQVERHDFTLYGRCADCALAGHRQPASINQGALTGLG